MSISEKEDMGEEGGPQLPTSAQQCQEQSQKFSILGPWQSAVTYLCVSVSSSTNGDNSGPTLSQ